ncbi:YciI-like protein [Mesoterricola silvestris]|uniref:YCII-related domain-containing protein n=1 Tax=Mesoterricola silvestris TaxID=2927979 RepID=A0AA48GKK7_9BACT|nr:YciI-like protein [Mesoterricola silvestris]BDU73047.1 hypothetical protein METEAL_22210 [Mesoterricola silvestris]
MHFLLIYDYIPEILERRGAFRAEHLALARQYQDRNELLLGGVLTEPVDSAILLFQGEGPGGAEAFAKADPYVRNGLVTRWQVRQWMTVVGRDAASPA